MNCPKHLISYYQWYQYELLGSAIELSPIDVWGEQAFSMPIICSISLEKGINTTLI